MIYQIMVNDLLHHHPLLSCTICFNNYASSISKYQAKLKESVFIKWEKPDLNQQVKHVNLTLFL